MLLSEDQISFKQFINSTNYYNQKSILSDLLFYLSWRPLFCQADCRYSGIVYLWCCMRVAGSLTRRRCDCVVVYITISADRRAQSVGAPLSYLISSYADVSACFALPIHRNLSVTSSEQSGNFEENRCLFYCKKETNFFRTSKIISEDLIIYLVNNQYLKNIV